MMLGDVRSVRAERWERRVIFSEALWKLYEKVRWEELVASPPRPGGTIGMLKFARFKPFLL